ncbi:uncharacterized protein UTRI_10136 [Ustilago trichophora]|uniref:Uncharacterized protein n=1 Tax=Ustilago trichophora TaxID=86804 RepID=A0A5C3E017_9BASI|nr:uncharacterized protein UTRI_10136 [Ustilago trichophora]
MKRLRTSLVLALLWLYLVSAQRLRSKAVVYSQSLRIGDGVSFEHMAFLHSNRKEQKALAEKFWNDVAIPRHGTGTPTTVRTHPSNGSAIFSRKFQVGGGFYHDDADSYLVPFSSATVGAMRLLRLVHA